VIDDIDVECAPEKGKVGCRFCKMDGGLKCIGCGAVVGCHIEGAPLRCDSCKEKFNQTHVVKWLCRDFECARTHKRTVVEATIASQQRCPHCNRAMMFDAVTVAAEGLGKRPLNADAVHALMVRGQRNLRRAAAQEKAREPKAVGQCVVCKADVKERLVRHAPLHDPHGVIGPSYRPLRAGYTEVNDYECIGCGLLYARAPGPQGRKQG
jgi:hypothetical protein